MLNEFYTPKSYFSSTLLIRDIIHKQTLLYMYDRGRTTRQGAQLQYVYTGYKPPKFYINLLNFI